MRDPGPGLGRARRAVAGHRRARAGSGRPWRPAARRARASRAPAAPCAIALGSPNPTFAATSRCGKSAPSWGTYPTRRPRAGTDLPAPATMRSPIETVPASGSRNPATSRSSVVLPQPDGPSTAVMPSATSRSSPSSTRVSPKDLASPATLRPIGWPIGWPVTARAPRGRTGVRRPSRFAARESSQVAGTESRMSRRAYGAAAPYSTAYALDQNSVASVIVPIGDSSSVAVSSVLTASETSARLAPSPGSIERQRDPAGRGQVGAAQ